MKLGTGIAIAGVALALGFGAPDALAEIGKGIGIVALVLFMFLLA